MSIQVDALVGWDGVGRMSLGSNTKRIYAVEASLRKTRAARNGLLKAIESGGPNLEHQRRNLRSIESYRDELKAKLVNLYIERIELV